ncbi:hypothetical protein Lal_00039203, partial [Lupinus albus]
MCLRVSILKFPRRALTQTSLFSLKRENPAHFKDTKLTLSLMRGSSSAHTSLPRPGENPSASPSFPPQVIFGTKDILDITKKLKRKIDSLTTLVTQLAMNQQKQPIARVCGICTSPDHYSYECKGLSVGVIFAPRTFGHYKWMMCAKVKI